MRREVGTLREWVAQLEASLDAAQRSRETALHAAGQLGTRRRKSELLARVFTRWLRACVLRPAKLVAARVGEEAGMLRFEMEKIEASAHQAGRLSAAAELHAGERCPLPSTRLKEKVKWYAYFHL